MPMTNTLELPPGESGRTGCVTLLGRPNTGKSTFLNTLLGCHLAAVSSKPQTTRKQLLGIYNDADSQILFLDTPGVHAAKIAIDEAMDLAVQKGLDEADIVICMLDPTRPPGDEDRMTAELAAGCGKPVLLLLNKIDLASQEQCRQHLSFYRQFLPDCPSFSLVALQPESVQQFLQQLKSLLPVGVFLFDREDITNVYERDIAADLIREALLEELQQEIPHCIAVTVDSWQEQQDCLLVEATLHLEREAHKGIVIGQGGRMIKKIRQIAKAKIGKFCQRKTDLSLFLKVSPNWRKRKQFLKDIRLLE